MSTAFHVASVLFLVALALCLLAASRGDATARLCGLEGVAICECLFLLVRAASIGRALFFALQALAVVVAALAVVG